MPFALRIATYNVHDCIGRDRRFDPGRIAAVVREMEADLVALQEVTLDHAGQLAARLAHDTGMEPIDGTVFPRGVGRYGNVILTRLPVLQSRLHDLSVAQREPRGALDLVVGTEAGELRVCATHLGLRRAERRWQLTRLAELLGSGDQATALVGDFNVWQRPRELAPLAALGFMHRRVYSFPTWPYPMFALDRIFTRNPVGISRCHRHTSPTARVASDHFPVVAELALPPHSS